jgi:two-component system, OmpR family, phosphate regulon sensor histidine kinase PhoR
MSSELGNTFYLFVAIMAVALLGGIGSTFLILRRRRSQRQQNDPRKTAVERLGLVSLINSMADAVIAVDRQGKVLLYNGAALDLLNTNLSLENRNFKDLISLRDEKDLPVDIIQLSDKANTVIKRDDLHFTSNEAQVVDLSVNISPIHADSNFGREAGFIIVMRDITKEKTLDEERNEFISVTSHELRTPIAITEANISTALLPNMSANLPPNIKELLEQAHHNIVFLGDLVNDLTTLARAERGDLSITLQPIEPFALLEELAKNYQSEAKAKGLEVIVKRKEGVHQIISSPLYVREVLQNFITNALKYTDKGSLTLSAEPDEGGGVIFSVKDTGIGISATDKKRVFSKFFRSEDFRTRKTRGTGLGLYITIKLAERINGKIWFDSELNVGSTFYLLVPPIGAQKKDHPKVAHEEMKDFAASV